MAVRNLIITQRQAPDRHGFPTDSLDNRYVACFSALGFRPIPIPNTTSDPEDYMMSLAPSALVLSGGGDVDPVLYGGRQLSDKTIAPQRDRLEYRLLDLAVRMRMPVLGICRGMQLINVYFGGGLDSVTLPARYSEAEMLEPHLVTLDDGLLRERFPEGCQVNSYHREVVPLNLLGKGIDPFAVHGSLPLAEGIRHADLPVAGIQWHPERNEPMTPIDRLLLEAFRDRNLFWEAHH